MYLDAVEFLICSRALMIAQTSAVNTDAESGNLMEITVFDGKTVAQATAFSSSTIFGGLIHQGVR